MGVLDFLRIPPASSYMSAIDMTRPAAPSAKALSDVTVPIERDWTVNWPWQDGGSGSNIGLVGGYSASYAQMYQRQPWINVSVNKLSRGVARLPLKLYGPERTRDKDSPLAQLLVRPYPGGTPFSLKSAIVGDLGVYGNAILIKQGARRPTDVPVALYPVSPVGWALADDGGYDWSAPHSGQTKRYAPHQVIHFRYWRPGAVDLGLSPLEPLRMTLAIEDAAQRLGVASFQNGARPSGVLRTDQAINREDLATLKEGIARMFRGVDKTALPAILTNGLDWKTMSWDMQQAAVVDFRKLTREEVAAVYDIPPPVIGMLDKATFSNVTEQGRWLVQHTYNVWTTLIEETLEAQLLYGLTEYPDASLEFDTSEILKGAPEQRFNAYAQAIQAGWVTQNEVRSWENLPRMDDPDADRLHRPMNLTPITAAPAPTGGANG